MARNFLPNQTMTREEAYYDGASALYPHSHEQREEIIDKQVKHFANGDTETKYYTQDSSRGTILLRDAMGDIVKSMVKQPVNPFHNFIAIEHLEPKVGYLIERKGPRARKVHSYRPRKGKSLFVQPNRYMDSRLPLETRIVSKTYFRNGRPLRKETKHLLYGYKLLNGKNVEYYKNGNVLRKTYYRAKMPAGTAHSVMHGILTEYSKKGDPISRTTIVDGKLKGWELSYSDGIFMGGVYHTGKDKLNPIGGFYSQDILCHKDKVFAEKLFSETQDKVTFIKAMSDRGVSGDLAEGTFDTLKGKSK